MNIVVNDKKCYFEVRNVLKNSLLGDLMVGNEIYKKKHKNMSGSKTHPAMRT